MWVLILVHVVLLVLALVLVLVQVKNKVNSYSDQLKLGWVCKFGVELLIMFVVHPDTYPLTYPRPQWLLYGGKYRNTSLAVQGALVWWE